MQGFVGRPIPIKLAFIQGNRPGFRAVAVVMPVPPVGCGAVIFIVWSWDNPVKYTDPDGRELNDLNEQQTIFAMEALHEAIDNLNDIINTIDDYLAGKSDTAPDDIRQAAKQHLGLSLDSPKDFQNLNKNLTKIRNVLIASNDPAYFSYDDETEDYAWVVPGLSPVFHLGARFFNTSSIGKDCRSGVLVHEASHGIRALLTNDGFFKNTPAHRIANNWEYFYEKLKTKG
jgi:hypothetical protein